MNSNDAIAEDPARLVLGLCRSMSERDVEGIGVRLASDAIWTIVGRPDRFPFGGTQSKNDFLKGIRISLSGFDRFRFDVVHWAQNQNTVFIEALVQGEGPGAARYSNRYLMRFLVRDGMIAEVLEHYDPFEALVYVEQLSK